MFQILISRNYTKKSEDSIESNFFSASTSFFQVYQVKNFFKVVALGNLSCNAELTFYCIIYLGLSFLDLLLCKVLCMITLLVPYLKSRSWTRTIQGRVVLFPKISQIGLQSFLVIPMGTLSYHLENERARSHAQLPKRVRSFTTIAIKRIRCGLDFSRF